MSQFKMYVDIPVRPHVKQYLEQNTFLKHKEFVLTSTSTVGRFLMQMVEPKSKAELPLRYNSENVIRVLLTDNYNFIVRPYISPRKAHQFNLFVEKKIKEEMFVFINCLTEYASREINDAIKEFQKKYGLKDDFMSFDCLKQDYYRTRRAYIKLGTKAA